MKGDSCKTGILKISYFVHKNIVYKTLEVHFYHFLVTYESWNVEHFCAYKIILRCSHVEMKEEELFYNVASFFIIISSLNLAGYAFL